MTNVYRHRQLRSKCPSFLNIWCPMIAYQVDIFCDVLADDYVAHRRLHYRGRTQQDEHRPSFDHSRAQYGGHEAKRRPACFHGSCLLR